MLRTTNIQDGVALADEATRGELAARYPDLWPRVSMRRAFMAGELGIVVRRAENACRGGPPAG